MRDAQLPSAKEGQAQLFDRFLMPLSEKATRKQLIDKALLSSGWEPIVRAGSERQRALAALEEFPTDNGPADYTLFYREQPLAVVEAKKLAVGPQNVLQQALRYASGLQNSPFNFNGYHVPFVYSTNGELI